MPCAAAGDEEPLTPPVPNEFSSDWQQLTYWLWQIAQNTAKPKPIVFKAQRSKPPTPEQCADAVVLPFFTVSKCEAKVGECGTYAGRFAAKAPAPDAWTADRNALILKSAAKVEKARAAMDAAMDAADHEHKQLRKLQKAAEERHHACFLALEEARRELAAVAEGETSKS